MQRFFVDPQLLRAPIIDLPAPVVHQLTHVLRARAGDPIVLLDDSGWEYEAELILVSPKRCQAVVKSKSNPDNEPHLHLVLYQALVREAKMDWVLQKGTELGAAAFIPFVSERSLNDNPSPNKYERWRRIITEAAEQSGRTRLPRLEPVTTLRECLASPPLDICSLFTSPRQSVSLHQALPEVAPREVRVYVGPEGGFTAEETEYARQQGLIVTRLGRRILRTETAGVAALAAILFKYNEL